jgi:hypothetical protein
MWSGHGATRSTDLGRMNSKAYWMVYVYSTPRESIRPGTATDSRVLQMRYLRRPKRLIKRKKLEELKGNFLEAHNEINNIYGGPDSYESRRKQKLIAQEVMVVSPATLEYLNWSEAPITFDRCDHPDFIPMPQSVSIPWHSPWCSNDPRQSDYSSCDLRAW